MEIESFETPEAFIFLYEHNSFLVIKERKIQIWSCDGHLIERFENESLAQKLCLDSSGYLQYIINVSTCKNMMICYNEFEDDDLKNHPSFSLLDLKNKTIIGELKLQTPSSEKEHLM